MEVAVERGVGKQKHNNTWWRCENPCLSIFENLNILPFVLPMLLPGLFCFTTDENMQSIPKKVKWECMEIKTVGSLITVYFLYIKKLEIYRMEKFVRKDPSHKSLNLFIGFRNYKKELHHRCNNIINFRNQTFRVIK